jgi:hypothetical protein
VPVPTTKRLGRHRHYTVIGILRVRCSRFAVCGNGARLEWQTCAIGGRWVALCPACDLELNRRALAFMLPADYGPESLTTKAERGGAEWHPGQKT